MRTAVPDGAGERTQRDREERERDSVQRERERENGKRESKVIYELRRASGGN